jgi:uncharacterized RDD family membrane protein YckC
MDEQLSKFRFATVGQRFVALLIDLALVVPAFCVLIYLVNTLLALPVEYGSMLQLEHPLKMNKFAVEHFVELVILYSFLKFAVVYSYSAFLESSRWQATVGKMLCGLQVVDARDGERISFRRATGRFLGKVLSSNTLLAGFALALFTKRRQALHDLLARTLVVQKQESSSSAREPAKALREVA